MLRRPRRGRPIDSKVFRPIKTGWPIVVSLNHFCSPGRSHGILFFFPITRFLVIATIAFIRTVYSLTPLLVSCPRNKHIFRSDQNGPPASPVGADLRAARRE